MSIFVVLVKYSCTPAVQVTSLTEVRLMVLMSEGSSCSSNVSVIVCRFWMSNFILWSNRDRMSSVWWSCLQEIDGVATQRKSTLSDRKSSSSFLHLRHFFLPLLHVFWYFVFSSFSLSVFHHLLLLLKEQNKLYLHFHKSTSTSKKFEHLSLISLLEFTADSKNTISCMICVYLCLHRVVKIVMIFLCFHC